MVLVKEEVTSSKYLSQNYIMRISLNQNVLLFSKAFRNKLKSTNNLNNYHGRKRDRKQEMSIDD